MMTEVDSTVTRSQDKECLEHQKLEDTRKDFLPEPPNKSDHMDTLISNFCPPE